MAEVISAESRPGSDAEQVAFADDAVEGEMLRALLEERGIASLLQEVGINGPMIGFGLLPLSAQRVMVRPDQAEAARRLLLEVLPEAGQGAPIGQVVDAAHLEATEGRRPRSYGVIGAYSRALAWSVGAMGLCFAVFLLLRAI